MRRAALAAGPLLVLGLFLTWDRRPDVETQRTELSQRRAAGFAKAAHGARSWAAQAFGAPQFLSRSRQQKVSDIGSPSPAARVRGARGRLVAAAGRPRSAAGAASAAVGDAGVSGDADEGESGSFYDDALASLPPAPRFSSLRGPRHAASFSDDAMQSLLSVHREASTSESGEGRMAQLAQEQPQNDPPAGQRPFALAPERRQDSYASAQDFGASLARLKEDHDTRRSERAARGQAPAEPVEQPAPQPSAARGNAQTAVPAPAAAAETHDIWGIPNGGGEAFEITRYKSAATRAHHRRVAGASGAAAARDIDSYFNSLVDSARDARVAPPPQKYFATRAARASMLSELAGTGPRHTATALHPRVHAEGAGAPAVRGGGRALAQAGKAVPVESVDAAVGAIKNEALAAERAILEETAAARHAISRAKAASQTARTSSAAPATAPAPAEGGRLRELFHAVAQPADEGCERASAAASAAAASGLKRHKFSGEDARRDLADGLDEQFRGSRSQDQQDSIRLRALSHGDAQGDLATFLSHEAGRTRRQDAVDERRLRERAGGKASLTLAKKEEQDSMRSEQEYDGALRDALHGGALPLRPQY